MADQRAEARRRRILENPAKRLERLQNLSRRRYENDGSASENPDTETESKTSPKNEDLTKCCTERKEVDPTDTVSSLVADTSPEETGKEEETSLSEKSPHPEGDTLLPEDNDPSDSIDIPAPS